MSSLPLPPLDLSLTPDQIPSITDRIIEDTTKLYDEIVARPKELRTKENTFRAFLSPPNFKTNPMVASVKLPSLVSSNSAIRDASSQAKIRLAQFRNVCASRSDVYHVLKEWNQEFGESQLDTLEKYVMKNVLRDFERNGLALSPEDRQKLMTLQTQETELSLQYSQNLIEDKTAIFVSDEELQGLPAKFIEGLPKNEHGKRILTLAYPVYLPIVETCDNEEVRKNLNIAKEVKCHDSNLAIITQVSQLRIQIAKLLGYPSYAHYILEKRLAKSPDNVFKFLNDVEAKVKDAASRDLQTLLQVKKQFKEARGEPFDNRISSWDSSFYQRKYIEQHHDFTDDQIRAYFPIQRVIEQTLLIYQQLLSLRFEQVPQGQFPTWDPEVQLFLVYDREDNRLIGHFYLDLFPREGKYNHAAIFHLVKRTPTQVPVDAMLANLSKPSPTEPSLLTHDSVVTFFHEFGHIMHSLCSEGDFNMTKFSKCPRDFVEAPSQMLENWCWTTSVLQKLSSHHITGEPLPDTLIQKLIQTKTLFEPLGIVRQVYLAQLDMILHSANPPTDLQQLVDDLRPKLTLIPNPPGGNILTTFGHIMENYMASYYGYLFSEVMSADMFATRFEKEGILNPKTGFDYRKKVLAPGGRKDANESLIDFLGRPPSNDAYLVRIGVTKSETK